MFWGAQSLLLIALRNQQQVRSDLQGFGNFFKIVDGYGIFTPLDSTEIIRMKLRLPTKGLLS